MSLHVKSTFHIIKEKNGFLLRLVNLIDEMLGYHIKFSLSITITLLCSQVLLAQYKWDNNWVISNYIHFQFDGNDVKTDILEHQPSGLRPGFFNTAISDKTGQLLFHSGGCYLLDSVGEILASGDSLSPGMFDLGFCQVGSSIWYQPIIILPFEYSSHSFMILNADAGLFEWPLDSIFFPLASFDLLGHRIQYDSISNQSFVVERNINTLHDTISRGYLVASKHANGRDWWVVVPKWNSNCYFILLFNSNGVYRDTLICSGPIYGDVGYGAQLSMSPDGNWIARSDPWIEGDRGMIYLYTFNRCDGTMEYYQTLYFEREFPSYTGVSFSPNSQYVYVSHYKNLWQYDVLSNDIQNSILLAGQIHEKLTPDKPSLYYQQLAPNGRIYISSPLGHRYLSTIRFPNNKGEEAGFEEHNLHMPENRQNYAGLPNYPNYRLGPIDGSYCDSLDINNNPVSRFRYDFDETQAKSILFTDLSFYRPEFYFWDFGDGSSSSEMNPRHLYSEYGSYEVCLTIENEYGSDIFCQTVNMINTSIERVGDQFMIVYPNPVHEDVYIISDKSHNHNMNYILFNCFGREVCSGKLNNEVIKVELRSQSSGYYYLHLIDDLGRVLQTEKVVKIR